MKKNIYLKFLLSIPYNFSQQEILNLLQSSQLFKKILWSLQIFSTTAISPKNSLNPHALPWFLTPSLFLYHEEYLNKNFLIQIMSRTESSSLYNSHLISRKIPGRSIAIHRITIIVDQPKSSRIILGEHARPSDLA